MDDFQAYYGVSLLQTVAVDVTGGIVAGTVIGALLPRVSGLVGYVVAAAAAIAPVVILFAVSTSPQPLRSAVHGAVAAVVVGSFLGWAVWAQQRKRRQSGQPRSGPP